MQKVKKGWKRVIAFVMATAVGILSCISSNTLIKVEGSNTKTIGSACIMNFGTKGLMNPMEATSASDEWTGSYVYFGIYDGSPVKYRVLDKEATEFGGTTILLDCDTVLWDGISSSGQSSIFDDSYNVWAESDLKYYLNSENEYSTTGFLTTSFTTLEQEIITNSTKSSAGSTNGTGFSESNYVALNGEKIFLLDAKEVTDRTYGYYNGDKSTPVNRRKAGGADVAKTYWWLRSSSTQNNTYVGFVHSEGNIYNTQSTSAVGVSPALNVNPSTILFTSLAEMEKFNALGSADEVITNMSGNEWKITLLDTGKTVEITDSKKIVKSANGEFTVPYTYTDNSTVESEKVNQISVMITSKEYTEADAYIMYYGALQNIKDIEGNSSTVANATSGTGAFQLPGELEGEEMGTDYYVYILPEHANTTMATDYAGVPVEITDVYDEISDIEITVDAPESSMAFDLNANISAEGIATSSANAVWYKEESVVSGTADYNTVYTVKVELTANTGYAFAKGTTAMVNGSIAKVTVKSDDRAIVSYSFPATQKGTISYTALGYSGNYDGNAHGIEINVEDLEGVNITYSMDGTNYEEANPQFTDKGNYTVYYKLEKENYTTVTGSKDVIIEATDITVTAKDQVIKEGEDIDYSNYVFTGLAAGDEVVTVILTPNTLEITEDGIIAISDAKIVNEEDIDVTDNYNIIYVAGKLVIVEDNDYEITDGDNQQWELDSEENLSISAKGDFAKLVGVKVSGAFLSETDFTVDEGSSSITIKSTYLNTLPEGTYEIEIAWSNGTAKATFTVINNQDTSGDTNEDADSDTETDKDVNTDIDSDTDTDESIDGNDTETDVNADEDVNADKDTDGSVDADIDGDEDIETDKENDTEPELDSDTPATGDSFNSGWIVALLVGGAASVILGIKKKSVR